MCSFADRKKLAASVGTKERMRELREALAAERLERQLKAVDACLPANEAQAVRSLATAILDKVRRLRAPLRACPGMRVPLRIRDPRSAAPLGCRPTPHAQRVELTPDGFRERVRALAGGRMDSLLGALSSLKRHGIEDSDVARERCVQPLRKALASGANIVHDTSAVKRQKLRIAEMRNMLG